MPVREGPPQPAPPHEPKPHEPKPREPKMPPVDTSYPAEKARGGEIVLRSRTQRLIFAAGLVGALLLALLLRLFM